MDHLAGTRIQRDGGPPTVNLRKCKLVVLKGSQRGTEHVISSDVIRVGKAEENDLTVSEETVSRVHFEIVRDAKGYLLRDLGSTNGTFLDGAEIREAYIRAGSVVAADVPPGVVVAGSPARVVKRVSELTCWPGHHDHPYAWEDGHDAGEGG